MVFDATSISKIQTTKRILLNTIQTPYQTQEIELFDVVWKLQKHRPSIP